MEGCVYFYFMFYDLKKKSQRRNEKKMRAIFFAHIPDLVTSTPLTHTHKIEHTHTRDIFKWWTMWKHRIDNKILNLKMKMKYFHWNDIVNERTNGKLISFVIFVCAFCNLNRCARHSHEPLIILNYIKWFLQFFCTLLFLLLFLHHFCRSSVRIWYKNR